MTQAVATIVAPTVARLVARAELAGDDVARMHRLLSSHFDGVTQDQFSQDLAEKNWAILIERAGRLVGFTTLLAYETQFDGSPISVIYSGDTIVAPEAWSSQTLPRAWIESVAKLRRHYPRGPYVWLLITSGFRTYRFLPLFWQEFFPRHDREMPAQSKQLIEHLAAERFGRQFDPASGILKLAHPQRLREELTGIPSGRREDPHVAFFAERNPGHIHGDELACVCELTPANLTPAGRRMASTVLPW
jgi:hypothetical protein